MIARGDVVLVNFPYTDVPGGKLRPALVIQNDSDNTRRRKTMVALITGNLRLDGDPSHLLIDPTSPDGASSGLHGPSLVSCNSLFTIEQNAIVRTIGSLSGTVMLNIDKCLKSALGLA